MEGRAGGTELPILIGAPGEEGKMGQVKGVYLLLLLASPELETKEEEEAAPRRQVQP